MTGIPKLNLPLNVGWPVCARCNDLETGGEYAVDSCEIRGAHKGFLDRSHSYAVVISCHGAQATIPLFDIAERQIKDLSSNALRELLRREIERVNLNGRIFLPGEIRPYSSFEQRTELPFYGTPPYARGETSRITVVRMSIFRDAPICHIENERNIAWVISPECSMEQNHESLSSRIVLQEELRSIEMMGWRELNDRTEREQFAMQYPTVQIEAERESIDIGRIPPSSGTYIDHQSGTIQPFRAFQGYLNPEPSAAIIYSSVEPPNDFVAAFRRGQELAAQIRADIRAGWSDTGIAAKYNIDLDRVREFRQAFTEELEESKPEETKPRKKRLITRLGE